MNFIRDSLRKLKSCSSAIWTSIEKLTLGFLLLAVLEVVFLAFILILFFYFPKTQTNTQQLKVPQQDLTVDVPEKSQGFPVRLIIPAINVSAGIQRVGITAKGEMDVPSNIVDVGWFKLGTRPGERGSAVIDGHVNGENGEAGVFASLDKLKEGDKLYIEDDKGVSITFIVREIRSYDPGYANEVFNQSDNAYLNLITCNGVWDEAKKGYSKRLVVFSDISQ